MPADPLPFPRTDFPESDPRAWLHDEERRLLEGARCPDITVEVTVKVELAEHRELRKAGKRLPRTLTQEQEERERSAGRLLIAAGDAASNAADLLHLVAQLRCDLAAAMKEAPDA